MSNMIYLSKNVNIPSILKITSWDEIIFTDTLSAGEISGITTGVFLSQADFSERIIREIIEKKHPVILWNFGAEVEKNPDAADLNVYFTFRDIPDADLFRQVVKNYLDFLQHKRQELHLKEESERLQKLNREFLKVGIALSAERDNSRLLNYIMIKTREVTKSDAGSLYLLDTDKKSGNSSMIFKIAHNDSNPADFTEFKMPVQKKSIAGYVAITGEVIQLDDAYSIPHSAEYSFNKSYDENTGYRTKSMLTVPMKNHKEKIIGVIQLINKKKDRSSVLSDHASVNENVIPFDKADVETVLALSSLAAVSLDNNQLYSEIEELFECLVRASAKAIEQRDPATSGHSSRVAKYTVALAEAALADDGVYKDVLFTEDQLKGLRYACLLHDFGKVGVRENVLVKAKKLYPGMLEQILLRFDNIGRNIKIRYLQEIISLDRNASLYRSRLEEIAHEERSWSERISSYKNAVIAANETSVLDSSPEEILEEIKNNTAAEFLSDIEYGYLSVKRGSLTEKERHEIMSHASHTYDFLKNIPWPENMDWIPEIARWHHEALDGSGYPDGKKAESLPLESRLMAVADIFDALTASDRPYKRSVPVEKALAILEEEAEKGKLDSEVVKLFIKNEIYKIAYQASGQ